MKTRDGSVSASQMLERFLFPPSVQYTVISRLSGGEKRRLYLLRILMEAPNVLLLDEPTNDLDIQTLTILEDYLDQFEGIVVAVSHDRYFLDRIVKRIFAFEGQGKVSQYEGGYTDYQIEYERRHPENSGGDKKAEDGKKSEAGRKEGKNAARKLRFTYQEQRDWEVIEDQIQALEEELAQMEIQIQESARDFVKLNQLTEEKNQKEAALESKMERWMYLNELAERIEAGERQT